MISPSSNRRKYDSPKRREQALQSRRRLVSAMESQTLVRGYSAVGVAEVAQAAGVSKALLYKHFDSKQSLTQALCDDVEERIRPGLLASTRRVLDSGSLQDFLDAFSR